MRGLGWIIRRFGRPKPAARPWSNLCERCGRRTTTVVVAMEDEGFELCAICRREWVPSDQPPREGAA